METKLQKLDARLSACVAYLIPGRTVADVGCDHGKLTAHLAQKGFFVIGTDINKKPLEVAKSTCSAMGCMEQVSLRLGDGLQPLQPLEAEQIVIAGVSAETILHILDDAGWIRTQGIRLVLCPATKIPLLRQGLCHRGFLVLDETPVVVSGRCYTVICAEYTAETWEPTQEFCLIGKTATKPFASELRDDTAIKLEKQLRGMAKESDEYEQAKELLEWLRQLPLPQAQHEEQEQ